MSNVTVVGSHAIKAGMSIVVQGQHVVYDGPVGPGVERAVKTPGAVIVTTINAKALIDKQVAKNRQGKPVVQTA